MEKNERKELTVEALYAELHDLAPHDERWQAEVTRWENGLPVKFHGRRRKTIDGWKGLINVYFSKRRTHR